MSISNACGSDHPTRVVGQKLKVQDHHVKLANLNSPDPQDFIEGSTSPRGEIFAEYCSFKVGNFCTFLDIYLPYISPKKWHRKPMTPK